MHRLTTLMILVYRYYKLCNMTCKMVHLGVEIQGSPSKKNVW